MVSDAPAEDTPAVGRSTGGVGGVGNAVLADGLGGAVAEPGGEGRWKEGRGGGAGGGLGTLPDDGAPPGGFGGVGRTAE